MARKPVIGVTVDYRDDRPTYALGFAYCDAVSAGGGLPVMLPYRSDVGDVGAVLDLVDGIVFVGGHDLDPKAWGDTPHPKSIGLDPDRERYERALMAEVERRRMATLGICLGSQLMNVTRGGSMRQFIPDLGLSPAIEHRRVNDADSRHPLRVETDSLLERVLGVRELESNSAHKQAYGRIGRGLRVVATAPDGIPEALEDPSMPFWLGVQWHPERIWKEGVQVRLFEALVAASRKR